MKLSALLPPPNQPPTHCSNPPRGNEKEDAARKKQQKNDTAVPTSISKLNALIDKHSRRNAAFVTMVLFLFSFDV